MAYHRYKRHEDNEQLHQIKSYFENKRVFKLMIIVFAIVVTHVMDIYRVSPRREL